MSLQSCLAVFVLLCVVCGDVFGVNTSTTSGMYNFGTAVPNNNNKQSRQYSSNSYPSYASQNLLTSPMEAIVVGVLAVCGLSLFGIPLLLMLMNLFNLNGNPGVSVIPTATTSVNPGRRKRSASPSPTNLLDQHLLDQVVQAFNTFVQSEHKMQLLQRLIS